MKRVEASLLQIQADVTAVKTDVTAVKAGQAADHALIQQSRSFLALLALRASSGSDDSCPPARPRLRLLVGSR